MVLIRTSTGVYNGIQSKDDIKIEKIGGKDFYTFDCISPSGKVRHCEIACDSVLEKVEYGEIF